MENAYKKSVGYWAHQIALAHRSHIEEMTKELGFGASDAFLLIYLYHTKQSSLVELAGMLDQAHPSVLRHIDHLESIGLVQRSPHPDDRRIKVVELTDEGKKRIPAVKKILYEVKVRATNGFTEDEVAQLLDFISRIHENLCGEDPCKYENDEQN